MPRFFKSKRPADVSGPKALAASSTAIALSIGSAFYDTPGTSIDGDTVRKRDAIWQTAYSAAKMALEVAKESSDMFLPLKAVTGAMSVLIKSYDQTSDNEEMVNEIERRVQSLSGVLASPVSEDDDMEKRRRAKLRRGLEGVVERLEPISEQRTLVRFLRNVDNAKTLTGFVRELGDAITDYRVSIQQGVYDDTRNIRHDAKTIRAETKNILEAADLEILEKLKPVHNAGYQSGHHDRCLPGTRKSVLQDIMLWAKNPQGQNVFWLNGLAGTGKSTITQSFSEAVADGGFLGASFFCSRNYLDRKELKNIFPTIAYQLACDYPHFRSRVIGIIKKTPSIAHTSLISQLENLLVKPLSGEAVSCVVVIDALDECIDDQPASAILSVLGRFVEQLPLVKFFITGRPEPRIRTGFRLPLLQPLTQVFLLHQVDLSSVDNDIQLYLTQRLTMIAKRRSDVDLPNPWPHDHEIKALAKKSSGLFIFASTVARFIESEHHEPNERLQLIVSETNSTTHEGRAGIDTLYSQVLLDAFSGVRGLEMLDNVRRVLGAIVLAFNPLSQRELSTVLGIPAALISTTLRHLHSVILVPTDQSKEIRIFHKSFPDFLQDRRRCTDGRFHIDPATYHGGMVVSCLELVRKLKRNPCSLPPFTMNQDVVDLPLLLEDKLGGGVRYACVHWARHLRLSPASPGPYANRVMVSATRTLERAPPWIEVMSLENRLEEVIYSMHGLLDWLDNVNTRMGVRVKVDSTLTPLDNLATDCLRLSMHFFHPIQQCAQQVYHTAVPLSPTSSHLRGFCLQSIVDNRLSCVTTFLGAPRTWGLLLRTIDVRPRQLTCIATSPHRVISACGDAVNVYDAVTGVPRQSLRASKTVKKILGSPDGSLLFFVHTRSMTMWDVQTGGLINTFTVLSEVNDAAVSATHIACGLSDGSLQCWDIHTKANSGGGGNGQPVVAICWLSHQELAVVTQNTLYIRNIVTGKVPRWRSIPGHAWGMVYLKGRRQLLVGTSPPGPGVGQECSFVTIEYGRLSEPQRRSGPQEPEPLSRSSPHNRRLSSPTLVGKEIACITPASGVQLFSTESYEWTNNPPLLGAAISVAESSNRNLVVQTKDSIQIFSTDVLEGGEAHNSVRPSDVYPLGEEYIVCVLRPTKHITILEMETLRELDPDYDALLPGPLSTNQPFHIRAPSSRGLAAELDISLVILAWQSGTPLPEPTETAKENPPPRRPSAERARVATFYSSLPSGGYSHTITRAEPMPLSEPRAGPPYTLDANYEWVTDVKSRKVCWIPPGNVRRDSGGHFWAGLVMVGDDGVVRKLTFKEPDC